MNASKTLISAIAAATIVGTVGFVSAQTSTTPTDSTATQGSGQMMNNQAPSTTTQGAQPSTGATTPSTDTTTPAATTPANNMSSPGTVAPSTDTTAPAGGSTTGTELAPQADRN